MQPTGQQNSQLTEQPVPAQRSRFWRFFSRSNLPARRAVIGNPTGFRHLVTGRNRPTETIEIRPIVNPAAPQIRPPVPPAPPNTPTEPVVGQLIQITPIRPPTEPKVEVKPPTEPSTVPPTEAPTVSPTEPPTGPPTLPPTEAPAGQLIAFVPAITPPAEMPPPAIAPAHRPPVYRPPPPPPHFELTPIIPSRTRTQPLPNAHGLPLITNRNRLAYRPSRTTSLNDLAGPGNGSPIRYQPAETTQDIMGFVVGGESTREILDVDDTVVVQPTNRVTTGMGKFIKNIN